MAKIILTKEDVYELVTANRYMVSSPNRFSSRCIDGRYESKDGLPPLAIPGADIGELALLAATANIYGFSVHLDKAYDSLVSLVGGIEKLAFHSDITHEEHNHVGCGYIGEIKKEQAVYYLEEGELQFISKKIEEIKEKGAYEILHGQHHEGALLQLEGNYSVYPRYMMQVGDKEKIVEVFVYHKSLADQRRQEWVKRLIETSAVVLYDNLDQEYLYEVLTNTAEEHLFETAKRLATGLPVFGVEFAADGSFKIKDLGTL